MHTALMGLRTDPSTAHGYAPSELLLGRKLVYPIELKKNDIDLSGNLFTSTLHFSQEHYHPQKVSVFTSTDSFLHQHLVPYFSAYYWGTKFTAPLIQGLKDIHDETFGEAAKKIKIYQEKYKRQYDEKNKVKNFTMKIGAKVQFKKFFSKRAKGAKSKIRYYPAQSYLVIHRIFRSKKIVILKNPTTNYVYKKKYPFDSIRRFKPMKFSKKKRVPRR